MSKVRTYSSGLGFGLKQIETYTGKFRDAPPRLREGPSKIFQPISRKAAAATLWKWRHREYWVRNPEYKTREDWYTEYQKWIRITPYNNATRPQEFIFQKELAKVRKKLREL